MLRSRQEDAGLVEAALGGFAAGAAASWSAVSKSGGRYGGGERGRQRRCHWRGGHVGPKKSPIYSCILYL
jgi:hypothetical protein